jgi:hypothetical protein
MANLNDIRPLGRSTALQMPRIRAGHHPAEILASGIDTPRRVPADVSNAMHQFMQIDERAFQRALVHVNQNQLAAKLRII